MTSLMFVCEKETKYNNGRDIDFNLLQYAAAVGFFFFFNINTSSKKIVIKLVLFRIILKTMDKARHQ